MKRKFLLLIFPILFLFSVIPVYADWTQVSKSGDWSICERTHWEQNDVEASSGKAIWEISISNFSGYYATVNFTELYTRRLKWWWERASKTVNIYWNFTSLNSGNQLLLMAGFWDYQRIWGLEFGRKVMGATGWNCKLDELTTYAAYGYDCYPAFVEIWVYKNSSEGKIYAKLLLYDPDVPDPYDLAVDDYFEISSEDFKDVKLTLIIEHEGCGVFKGGLSDTIYIEEESWNPTIPSGKIKWVTSNWFWDFVDGTKRFLSKTLPGYVMNYINVAGQWANFFLELIVLIGYSALQFLPFFPIIFLFWLLDAGLTSIVTGDFRIVGDAVMTIYNTLRGIVQAIINIGETIWSIIKFW